MTQMSLQCMPRSEQPGPPHPKPQMRLDCSSLGGPSSMHISPPQSLSTSSSRQKHHRTLRHPSLVLGIQGSMRQPPECPTHQSQRSGRRQPCPQCPCLTSWPNAQLGQPFKVPPMGSPSEETLHGSLTTWIIDQIIGIQICLETTHFSNNEKLYRKLHGCSTGGSISPILANLVMENFELQALNSYNALHWDFGCTAVINRAGRDGFFEHICGISGCIGFAWGRCLDDGLAFLDCGVEIGGGCGLATVVCRGSTRTDRCLQFVWCRPLVHGLDVVGALHCWAGQLSVICAVFLLKEIPSEELWRAVAAPAGRLGGPRGQTGTRLLSARPLGQVGGALWWPSRAALDSRSVWEMRLGHVAFLPALSQWKGLAVGLYALKMGRLETSSSALFVVLDVADWVFLRPVLQSVVGPL